MNEFLNLTSQPILVIEDDPQIWSLIEIAFEQDKYRLLHAWTGAQALELLRDQAPAVILIDVLLPDANGIDLCRAARAAWPTCQILLMTSLNDLINKVIGLEAGADDYITKPFNEHELRARVRTALRRSLALQAALRQQAPSSEPVSPQLPVMARAEEIEVADLKISLPAHQAWRQGRALDLTPKEFEVLCLLASSPGKVYTRKALIDALWAEETGLSEVTINGHIRRLREKVDEPFRASPLIDTVRGIGYRLQLPDH